MKSITFNYGIMEREKLICDKRGGCVAIYKESRKSDTNGCHFEDERNIAYSSMVKAYNEKYCL